MPTAKDNVSHAWTQTITINQNMVKQLIQQQTPLLVSSIRLLGEGFDNIAYLINEEYLFRFPRREMGVDCMKNEIAILPYIATKISFPFSYPHYIGKESDIYKTPFAGYKLLPGKSLCDIPVELIDDPVFADALASWLKQLHAVPVLENHRNSLHGEQDWRYDAPGKLERSKARILQYESYFIDAGFNKNDLFFVADKLSASNRDCLKNAYVHGDLYSRHLLINANKELCGIIDWGDIHIGNPGSDLSVGYMILSDKALDRFFDNYGDVTDEMKYVAIVRAFCHPIALLPYCYEKNEEGLKEWTILALQRAVEIAKNFK